MVNRKITFLKRRRFKNKRIIFFIYSPKQKVVSQWGPSLAMRDDVRINCVLRKFLFIHWYLNAAVCCLEDKELHCAILCVCSYLYLGRVFCIATWKTGTCLQAAQTPQRPHNITISRFSCYINSPLLGAYIPFAHFLTCWVRVSENVLNHW